MDERIEFPATLGMWMNMHLFFRYGLRFRLACSPLRAKERNLLRLADESHRILLIGYGRDMKSNLVRSIESGGGRHMYNSGVRFLRREYSDGIR